MLLMTKLSILFLLSILFSFSSFAEENNRMQDDPMMGVGVSSSMRMQSRINSMDKDMGMMSSTMSKILKEKDKTRRVKLGKDHMALLTKHMSEMQSMMGLMKGMMGQDYSKVIGDMKEMQLAMGKMERMMGQVGYMVDKNFNMCVED